MTIPASAGALVSAPDDLLSWMRGLVDGRVVSRASFQQMITPATVPGGESADPYGLGFYVWRVRGETMIGHTGQINGFASIAAYVPSRDITIVALGNSDSFDAQNFGRRLAAIALGNPYTVMEEVPISTADLAAIAGRYRDGAEVRTLLAREGKLYSQRAGRNPLLLQMTANGELHFVPDELSYFVPVRNPSGTVVRLDYFFRGDGPPRPLPRIRE
jgi:CubicO group peptidase (beta-lactamase class C family)